MFGPDLTFGSPRSKSRDLRRDGFRRFPVATRFDTLWAVFSPVVQSGCRFDKHVLYARRLWNLSFGGRIATQFIGKDLARHRVRAQHTLEEALGRGLIAPLLQQDVEFGAVLVHCAP